MLNLYGQLRRAFLAFSGYSDVHEIVHNLIMRLYEFNILHICLQITSNVKHIISYISKTMHTQRTIYIP